MNYALTTFRKSALRYFRKKELRQIDLPYSSPPLRLKLDSNFY